MSKKSKTLLEHILNIIFLISLFILSIWLGYRVYQSTKTQSVTAPISNIATPQTQQSQYPDYDKITNENSSFKPLLIVSHKANNQPASKKTGKITKKYKVNGKISNAYLYFEGYVDYGRQFTTYDDLYLTINKHGGHIHINDNKDNRIKTPMDSEKTTMLYNLNSISFVDTYFQGHRKDHTTHNYNFYDLIINSPILDISFFISSDRKGSNINELSIYYQCADDSQNCNISEILTN